MMLKLNDFWQGPTGLWDLCKSLNLINTAAKPKRLLLVR